MYTKIHRAVTHTSKTNLPTKKLLTNYIGNRSILKQDETTSCWLCLAEFVEGETKCLDHCHYSDEFLRWAHSKFNLGRRKVRYTPVVGHNIQNYDLHHGFG